MLSVLLCFADQSSTLAWKKCSNVDACAPVWMHNLNMIAPFVEACSTVDAVHVHVWLLHIHVCCLHVLIVLSLVFVILPGHMMTIHGLCSQLLLLNA